MPYSGRFPAVDCILFSSPSFCKILCLFSPAMLLQMFWDRIRKGYTIQLFFFACVCVYYRIICMGNTYRQRATANFIPIDTLRFNTCILIMKANKMHYFSDLFDKVLYMFRTSPLSIIRNISTLYTRNN